MSYQIQYLRLKRHYEFSINNYDIISFLDLAHSLRIWTEIINEIDLKIPKTTFAKFTLTKPVKKILTGTHEFLYVGLYKGVSSKVVKITDINGSELITVPQPSENKFNLHTAFKFDENEGINISQLLFSKKVITDGEALCIQNFLKNPPIQKMNFKYFMNSPCINFRFDNYEQKHITNLELIKRIANEYDASHANAKNSNFELNNVFSGPVKLLMEIKCAKLPLPYFVILHTAKMIIDNYKNEFST